MAPLTRFKRYEWKYLISDEQYAAVCDAITSHVAPDVYAQSSIRNLYYDTPDFRIIRHSLEKPVYKEKLRLRAYANPGETGTVFLELKKKYDGIVYKRREVLPYRDALARLDTSTAETQIAREIAYFLSRYPGIRPAMWISYEREAYAAVAEPEVRITFDREILWRVDDLSLNTAIDGTPLLPHGVRLMEIKLGAAMPLWLSAILTRERIYRTGFSKYGSAYRALQTASPSGKEVEQYA